MVAIAGSAPAKVNLALKVLGLRQDGFHELRTVFQTISLSDRLRVTYQPRRDGGVRLSCNKPELGGLDNLAARAAAALLEAGPWRGSVSIELDKRIPVGAGLGGGSSDAAAVLLALARLLKPPPAQETLFEVAARIGSDVPFFLLGGAAVGVGRGEEVYPLPENRRKWLVLLVPDFEIPTAEAYRLLRRSRSAALTPHAQRPMIIGFCAGVSASKDRWASHPAGTPTSCFENDFEKIVFQRYPELAEWKQRLIHAGASQAMLSGSGSALFGMFADPQRAVRASASMGAFAGNVFVARTLSRRACRRLWAR